MESFCRHFELARPEENHSYWRIVEKRCVLGAGCHCHLRNSRRVGGTGSSSSKWRGRWARYWSGQDSHTHCRHRCFGTREFVVESLDAVTERNERSRCEGHHLEGNVFDPQFVQDEGELDHGNHMQIHWLGVEEQCHLGTDEEHSPVVGVDSCLVVDHVD